MAFSFAPDTRRFDNGTPACMASIASLPALDWHAAQDHAAILAHNRSLTAKIIKAIDALRLPLLTPRPESRRGGSVMVQLPQSLPAAALVSALRRQGFSTDARGQTLRLSPGVMTSAEGTEGMLEALGKLLA